MSIGQFTDNNPGHAINGWKADRLAMGQFTDNNTRAMFSNDILCILIILNKYYRVKEDKIVDYESTIKRLRKMGNSLNEKYQDATLRKTLLEAAEAIESLLKNDAERQTIEKPLTMDRLKQMNGRPAWWDGGDGEGCWGIIEVDSDGPYAGKPFFEGRWKNINFSWDIKENKMMIYARELSREEWEAQKGRDKQ